jgi:hypothetical protein
MMWSAAWQTAATLFGGLALGVLSGDTLFKILPGSNQTNPQVAYSLVAAIPALSLFALGSANWGRAMARLAGASPTSRMTWAGILGFAPITILVGFALFLVEPIAVKQFGERLPIHRLFTLLFVPSAFIISAVSAWSIGIGLRDRRLARSMALRVGVSAALTFLAVNLIMETAGWVVGAPGAAERATMLTVMGLGNLAAAVVGGAIMGRTFAQHREPPPRILLHPTEPVGVQ